MILLLLLFYCFVVGYFCDEARLQQHKNKMNNSQKFKDKKNKCVRDASFSYNYHIVSYEQGLSVFLFQQNQISFR